MTEKTELTKFVESRGWEFFQDSPTEGKWFKFDKDGNQIAKEGDAEWNAIIDEWREKR